MTMKNFQRGVLAAGFIGIAGVLPVSAELPTLDEKDWLGYFTGMKTRSFQFGVTAEGKGLIRVFGDKGNVLSQKLSIPVEFKIEETMPDGKTISRSIKPETLESAQAATNQPKNVVFKGQVTGGIGFEVFVNEEQGAVSLGGRLLEPAALKNPTRFSIATKIPNAYPDVEPGGDKKAAKAFEEKTKGDRVQLNWTDGKRTKFQASEPVEAASKEVSGPGVAGVLIDFSSYKGQKIQLTAAPNSSMALTNASKQPLAEGFSIIWTVDSAKDPEAKARLLIGIK